MDTAEHIAKPWQLTSHVLFRFFPSGGVRVSPLSSSACNWSILLAQGGRRM
jgi:hypothetical protein